MSTIARIVTVCQNGKFHPSVEANRDHVMEMLDRAVLQKHDLVVLPEAFASVSVKYETKDEVAETIPGPTTDAAARRARQAGCYVICPVVARRDGRFYNSAAVIDRQGAISGVYEKVHPVASVGDFTSFEGGIQPGGDTPVFDLDFGRVAIQICFDLGFPETWAALAESGARIVFWPSAYDGGFPLRAYAWIHHYFVVSSVRSGRSKIIDPLGAIRAQSDPRMEFAVAEINTDFIACHWDYNHSIPRRILESYPGRAEVRSDHESGHFLVEPLDPAVKIADLQREFGFESAHMYHQRHRVAHARMLEGQPPLAQNALHNGRQPYGEGPAKKTD